MTVARHYRPYRFNTILPWLLLAGIAMLLVTAKQDASPPADAASTVVPPVARRAAVQEPAPPSQVVKVAGADSDDLDWPDRNSGLATNGFAYGNCAQARAAGATPIHRGEYGYAPWLDGDHDGIACEPWMGKR